MAEDEETPNPILQNGIPSDANQPISSSNFEM